MGAFIAEVRFQKYRTSPTTVEAFRWMGGDLGILNRLLGRNWARADAVDVEWTYPDDKEQVVVWDGLDEEWVKCPAGFWVVRDVRGGIQTYSHEDFSKLYEPDGGLRMLGS